MPYNPSIGTLVGKTIIWLIIWTVVAMVIFAITILFGSQIAAIISWLWQIAQDNSPFLWMIMLIIAFISSMVGTILVAFVYGLMYGDIYPWVGKLTWYALLANVILFLLLAPLYIVVYKSVNALFMVLGFHTIMTVFVTSVMNEIAIDAHYSLSAISGWLIWLASVVLVFMLIYQIVILNNIDVNGAATTNQIQIMLSIPALLSYTLIPLAHGIRQKIYAWLCDMGSNFLYASSRHERIVAAQMTQEENIHEEEINVQL